MTNHIEGLPPFKVGYRTWVYFQKIYLTDPSPLFILFTNSLHFAWVAALLYQQISFMLLNLTMTEAQLEHENHYQRDRNPWDLGSPILNAKQFFAFRGFDVDWTKVYREEDYRPQFWV